MVRFTNPTAMTYSVLFVTVPYAPVWPSKKHCLNWRIRVSRVIKFRVTVTG